MTIRSFEGTRPHIAVSALVDETALVIGDVEIGADASVWPMCVVRGDIHRIRIGARTNLQDGTVIHVTHDSRFCPGGQPTLIGDDMPSFALAQSLATVKSLVMGGFGVGSLLHFMLDADDREVLVRAKVPHDPDCGVYLVASDSWTSEVEDDIRREMVAALRGAFPDVE